jgi:hypothetical protein
MTTLDYIAATVILGVFSAWTAIVFVHAVAWPP